MRPAAPFRISDADRQLRAPSRAIDSGFRGVSPVERPDAVFLGQNPFFNGRRLQLANWAARHALPMTSRLARHLRSRRTDELRSLNIVDSYRQEGAGYVDRILKGEPPADMPVQVPTKFELVINSRPPRRSASNFHPHCSPAPTR